MSFILLWSIGANFASAQSKDEILGKWLTMEGKSHIEIYKPAGKDGYFGKIVWLKEPLDENGQPKKDTNGNQVLNMVNLKNFKFESGEWVDGTIYDPESGKTYHCTMELENNDVLKVRGSVDSWGWIGRTDTWTRVK
jgi:uncharacterized protein (DUF2147 family)